MKKLFVILLTFVFFHTKAQQIIVLDEDNSPLQNVEIYDGINYVYTDTSGKADISRLDTTQELFFRYEDRLQFFTYKELKKRNFKIILSENYFELENIIISAIKWEQKTEEIPLQVLNLDIPKALSYFPQTTADLIGKSGKIFIQKSQLGGGSPMIRGFAANRLLLVIDGVRMNNAIYRSGNLQNIISIDPYIIDDAEVILGAGSVAYGSDAIGGVIDFHTKNPRFSETKNLIVNGNGIFRFFSADLGTSSHFDISFGKKKFAFLSSLSFSSFKDLRMGKFGPDDYLRKEFVATFDGKDTILQNPNPLIQKFSGFAQIFTFHKFVFRPKPNLEASYTFYYSTTSNIPRYDRLIQYKNGLPKYAQWYYGPQTWQMHSFSVKNRNQNFFSDNMKLTFAYQDYKESRHDRKFRNTALRERFENVKIFSSNIDIYKKISQKQTLFYGSEFVYNKVFSRGKLTDIIKDISEPYPSRYPDNSYYTNYGIYFQDKITVSDRVIFNAGIRWTQTFLYARFDTTFYKFPFTETFMNNYALTWTTGAVCNTYNNWHLSFNAGTGFRAPNIDDVGKVFDSEPGSVVVPNPSLKPEYITNFEISIQKTSEDFFVSVEVFYSLLKNAIVRRNFQFNGSDTIIYDGEPSRVKALVNAASAKVYGVQAGAGIKPLKFLILKANYNITSGFDNEGNPLRHVPPNFGDAHLEFFKGNFNADFFVVYNSEIPYEKLAPSEKDKTHMYAKDINGNPYSPAWYTLNIKFAYKVSEKLKIYAGVENITDVRYRPYSSGICAPGRNFTFDIRYGF